MHVLGEWVPFATIVGAAAATLIGLTFVAIMLLQAGERVGTLEGVSTFTTPTVVHLGAALVVACLLAAPWRTARPLCYLLGVVGAYGLSHLCGVGAQARRMTDYRPDREDWAWYVGAPMAAYAALLAAAIALSTRPQAALYGVAGAILALLVVGVRNAWDIVTYLVVPPSDADP